MAAETAAPTTDASAVAQRWIEELGRSEAAQQRWLTRSRRIFKKYRQERGDRETSRQYAMLWSNTQTILPTVYSRPPEPVVSRRFKDEDPVGRLAPKCLSAACPTASTSKTWTAS
jgi:hypothetical protein